MKYELTTNSKIVSGKKVFQIKALCDIPLHSVKAGDLGGWISSEKVLTQQGDAWVRERGVVIGDGFTCKIRRNTLIERGVITNSTIDVKLGVYCKEIKDSSIIGDDILISGLLEIKASEIETDGRVGIYDNADISETEIKGSDIHIGAQSKVHGAHIEGSNITINGRKLSLKSVTIVGDNIKVVSPFTAERVTIKGNKIDVGNSDFKLSTVAGNNINIRGLILNHSTLELNLFKTRGNVSIDLSSLVGEKVKMVGDIEMIACSGFLSKAIERVNFTGQIYLKYVSVGENISLNGIVELVGLNSMDSVMLCDDVVMDGIITIAPPTPEKDKLVYQDKKIFGDYSVTK